MLARGRSAPALNPIELTPPSSAGVRARASSVRLEMLKRLLQFGDVEWRAVPADHQNSVWPRLETQAQMLTPHVQQKTLATEIRCAYRAAVERSLPTPAGVTTRSSALLDCARSVQPLKKPANSRAPSAAGNRFARASASGARVNNRIVLQPALITDRFETSLVRI